MVSENKNSTSLFNLVISHYLISAICFLILSVMLLFSADMFKGHYFQPRLLAVTHMAALGWGSLMIFGSVYQFLEYVPYTGLYSKWLAWLTLILFIPGLAALVTAFWVFDPGFTMQAGSMLLFVSVLLFVFNVYMTVRKNKKETLQDAFVLTSCWWLGFTAMLGALMVFNFRFAFLPQDHLHFLRLHAQMGVGGWFLLLIMGVSSKLVPFFLKSDFRGRKLLNWSYYLTNGALVLFLADTYTSGINFKSFAILGIGICGIGCFLIYIYKCFRSRADGTLDLPMIQTLFSFLLLAVATLILPFVIHYYLKNDPLSIRFTMLFGSLVFMGWITSLIIGQVFKTLPFIITKKNHHTQNRMLFPQKIINSGLFKVQTVLFLIFCVMFYAGLFFLSVMMIRIALYSLVITAAVYTIAVTYFIVSHKVSRL